MLSTFKQVFVREVTDYILTKQIVFATLIGPLLALVITVSMFYNGVVSDLSIGVVNFDNSASSRTIIENINATKAVNVVDHFATENEAIEQVKSGAIYGFVVVDNGFEKSILKSETATVKCYINGLNVMVASSIENGIYNAVSSYSRNAKIEKYMKAGVVSQVAEINSQPIRVHGHTMYNPFKSFSYFLTVSILPLLLLVFIFLSTVYSLGIELKKGSAEQLLEITKGRSMFIVAKLLPYTLIYFLWGVIYTAVEIEMLAAPVTASIFLVILSYLLLVLTYQSMAVVMVSLTSNMRLSLSLGSAYTMMALTFSGVTFPSMAMDGIAQLFGTIFPYFYIIKSIFLATLKDGSFTEVLTVLRPTFIYMVIGVVSMKFLWYRYSDAKFYYKD